MLVFKKKNTIILGDNDKRTILESSQSKLINTDSGIDTEKSLIYTFWVHQAQRTLYFYQARY